MSRHSATILFLFFQLFAFSQTGKDFWFAVPYIDKTHDSGNGDLESGPNYFRILAGEAEAEVSFYAYQDENGNASAERELFSITVSANTVSQAEFTVNASDTLDPANHMIYLPNYTNSAYSTVTNKGIRISSTNPVSIYYEIGSYNNTDIFSLKGKDALGTDFMPTFQNIRVNKDPANDGSWGTDSWATVDIVATEDNTTIEYYLPDATSTFTDANGTTQSFTYPASPTSISLNKGQTYSIKADTRDAIKKLQGIKISSDKKIAITIKDDTVFEESATSKAGDVVGDQIVPTSIAGTKYIIPDFDAGQNQGFFIRALEDNTPVVITKSGVSANIATLNTGEIYSYTNFNNDGEYIIASTGDKQSICFQLAGYPSSEAGLTEFAGAAIPPVDECTGSTQTSFNIPQTDRFSIALISRTNEADSFQFKKEGDASWTTYNPVFQEVDIDGDNITDWYYRIISEDSSCNLATSIEAGKSFILRNQSATFHLGSLTYLENGGGRGSFYGYFSDFTSPEIQISFSTKADGQVQLYAFGGVKDSYSWDRINFKKSPTPSSCYQNFFSDEPNPATCDDAINPILLSKRMLDNDGFYFFSATGQSICSGNMITSTVDIEVKNSIAYLPIVLTYFNACPQGDKIRLRWETLSELNCNYFILERSTDGRSFEPVTKKFGAGTSTIPVSYSHIDQPAHPGTYYYRLKQIDFDGTYTYSDIISANIYTNGYKIVVSPTLIKQNEPINILINGQLENTVSIHIFNANGQAVYSTISDNNSQFQIEPQLATGIFELFIRTKAGIDSHKIIVLK